MLTLLFTQYGCEKGCMQYGNCLLEPETGNCFASHHRYYFDPVEKKCEKFVWGGCGGVVPFETLEECIHCECNE